MFIPSRLISPSPIWPSRQRERRQWTSRCRSWTLVSRFCSRNPLKRPPHCSDSCLRFQQRSGHTWWARIWACRAFSSWWAACRRTSGIIHIPAARTTRSLRTASPFSTPCGSQSVRIELIPGGATLYTISSLTLLILQRDKKKGKKVKQPLFLFPSWFYSCLSGLSKSLFNSLRVRLWSVIWLICNGCSSEWVNRCVREWESEATGSEHRCSMAWGRDRPTGRPLTSTHSSFPPFFIQQLHHSSAHITRDPHPVFL